MRRVAAGGRYRQTLIITGIVGLLALVVALFVFSPDLGQGQSRVYLLAYAALLLFAWIFPVRIGYQRLYVSLGVQIPLFLHFGTFDALIVSLVCWVIAQVVLDRRLSFDRLIGNASILVIGLVAASLVYRLMTGQAPPINWLASPVLLIFPVFAFALVYFVVNYGVTLAIVNAKLRDDNLPAGLDLSLKWDVTAFAFELLIASVFIELLHVLGNVGFLVAVIPIAAVVYMFFLYSNLVLANRQLSQISRMTHRISQELVEDRIISLLVEQIPKLVHVTGAYVFLPDEEGVLVPVAVRGSSAELEERMRQLRLRPGEGQTAKAYATGDTILVRSVGRSTSLDRVQAPLPVPARSILCVPLQHQGRHIGVLTLTHRERAAFTQRDCGMVEILAHQASIGLWNARLFEESAQKGLVDSLTGVYNYRYFNDALEDACQHARVQQQPVTLLVLDLDDFKRVNDAHGHEAGNEVLRTFAGILKQQVREGDVVCRYGGEEFTVILPGASLEVGTQVAERLRKAVESHRFALPRHGDVAALPVHVTVSVGAATFPDMADSAQSLIRNADRAMYVGSKQVGKNRVGIYERYEATSN